MVPIAQSAERRSVEPEVTGSSPVRHPHTSQAIEPGMERQRCTNAGALEFDRNPNYQTQVRARPSPELPWFEMPCAISLLATGWRVAVGIDVAEHPPVSARRVRSRSLYKRSPQCFVRCPSHCRGRFRLASVSIVATAPTMAHSADAMQCDVVADHGSCPPLPSDSLEHIRRVTNVHEPVERNHTRMRGPACWSPRLLQDEHLVRRHY